MAKFVQNAFGQEMLTIPMAAHIALLMSYWDMTHGLDLKEVEPGKPYEGTATFRNRLTGELNYIFIRVDTQKPHQFLALRSLDEAHLDAATKLPSRSAQPIAAATISARMDDFMNRLAKAGTFSGVVEIAKSTGPIFRRAYGPSNREAGADNMPDTKFVIGSIGKTFTAVAIAQLAQEGKLSYDDPLSKFLPQFPNATQIKIKHLLSHTSGLQMWWSQRPPPPGAVAPVGAVDAMFSTITDDEPLQFPPGSSFLYSNTGYLVLGKVIEVVTGSSYAQYLQESVFKPSGMTNTSLEFSQQDAVRYQKNFDISGHPTFIVIRPPPGARPSPFGGAVSTADDMVKFAQALRSGKLLNLDNVGVLFRAKPELAATRYGYGFDIDERRHIVGHGGGAQGVSNFFDMISGFRFHRGRVLELHGVRFRDFRSGDRKDPRVDGQVPAVAHKSALPRCEEARGESAPDHSSH